LESHIALYIYRGASKYTRCHRKSLCMAKKLCEDISDLLLNEKVKITIKDEATSVFVKKVLEDANFMVQGNEYQERKAACGTVAYVPYLSNMVVAEDGSVLSAEVKLNYVVAKNIFPTAWENSRVTECVFVFEKMYKRKKYAHFQYHKLEPWVNEAGQDIQAKRGFTKRRGSSLSPTNRIRSYSRSRKPLCSSQRVSSTI
jgi:A118 family predicted phage portal protein